MKSDSVKEILTFGNNKRIQVQSFSLICTDLFSNEREKDFQFKLLMSIVINQKGVKGNILSLQKPFQGNQKCVKIFGAEIPNFHQINKAPANHY